jgi:hypothetical protein
VSFIPQRALASRSSTRSERSSVRIVRERPSKSTCQTKSTCRSLLQRSQKS